MSANLDLRNPSGPAGTRESSLTPEEQVQAYRIKEAQLDVALRSAQGLSKIAANLVNPVKKQRDYEGVVRKLAVVEGIPDGVPIFYDKDIPEFTSVRVGKNGTTRIIEIEGERVDVEPFWIVSRPKIPFSELYIRKFKVLARAKQRLAQATAIREDLYGYSLIDTASTVTNSLSSTAGALDRATLAKAFAQVEQHRLHVRGVILSAFGTMGIRRWEYHKEMNEDARTALFSSGYIGRMWNSEFFESDKISAGNVYLVTEPEYLMWIPIRKDYDVIAASDPDNLLLGFVGAEFLGMVVHNSWGCSKATFSASA